MVSIDTRNGGGVADVTPRSSASVVRAGDEHVAALAAFYRRVWDPAATPAQVSSTRAREAERNPIAPGEPNPAFLFMLGDEVVGHLAALPLLVGAGATRLPAHCLKGLWVLPEHRRGPVGFMVLRTATQALGTVMAFVVQDEPRRLYDKLGYTDLGVLSNRLRVLDAGEVLRRLDPDSIGVRVPRAARAPLALARTSLGSSLASTLLRAGTRALTMAAGRHSSRLRVELPSGIDAGALDTLWSRIVPGWAGGIVRDGVSVTTRYPAPPDGPYRFVAVLERGELVGVGVVRPPGGADERLRGIRIATLADLWWLADRPGAGLAVLAGAERAAREMGAHALLCSTSHRAADSLLRRRAFVRIPGNVHVVLRNPSRVSLPMSLGEWWLTRGDGAGDEV